MARTRKDKQLNFRITKELADEINVTARQLGITSAEFIRLSIKLQVNARLNPVEEDLVNELNNKMVHINEKQ